MDSSAGNIAGTPFENWPLPPCAALLGWQLIDHDAARGWARLGFQGRDMFLNRAGFIQGGFLAAMLDDTLGPTVLLHSKGAWFTSTIDLHVQFLAPAKPGPLFGEGLVTQMGKTIAFMEGKLMTASGQLVARATGSARLVPTGKVPT